MSLNRIRALLGILGGVGAGAAVAGIIYGGPTMIGVGVAVAAACVIGIGLIRAIQADRQRLRRYREDTWQRRITEAHAPYRGVSIIKGGKEPGWLFYDLKPWPVGDDEVRR